MDNQEMNASLFAKRQRDEEIKPFLVIWYNAMECPLDDEAFSDYETAECRAYDMVMNEENMEHGDYVILYENNHIVKIIDYTEQQ